ncbi:MAG TPA: hypothetical protein VFY26_01220, partial [Anaerolineales bacterium]|nr:hypothetical protein [Anaerolineales bacterium]
MKRTNKLTVLSIVVLFSLLSSVLFPTAALADDATPPPVETAEVQPTEEPVVTEEPVSTDEPVVTDVPTEAPVLEATPSPEEIAPAATEEPVVEEESATEETEPVDLVEVVAAAAESEVLLADSDGDPLVLGTLAAAETLTTGDPYIVRSGVTHRFLTDCTGQPIDAFNTCTESSTPIQAAIDFAVPYETVNVLPGTYAEQLVINTANLTLLGLPGDTSVAGAAWNAPVLDGATIAGTTTGITINVEGVTVAGFIIQNYDMAIYQPVVVGNNAININNNTIQNNGDGIKVISEIGAPGTIINYNVFLNNSGNDVTNSDPNDNNVQNLDIKNNYWGCAEGPVVVYKKYEKVQGNTVFVGWRYRYWATPKTGGDGSGEVGEYTSNPNSDCALLYGSDSLWNHQINNPYPNYSPYKFLLDGVETNFETSPTPTA